MNSIQISNCFMSYNVVIVDGELSVSSLKSRFNDFDEAIRYTLFNPLSFIKLSTFSIPVDVYVLRIMDNENIPLFVKKIRQISHFSFIPIIVVDDTITKNELCSSDFDLIDVVSEMQYQQRYFLDDRILFMCKTTKRYKRFHGENTILKSKLIELERLRIKNDFLFSSTKSLEDINQELKYQRDEIELQKKEIETEKRKSEELLKNILPEETSRELMIHGEAKTQFYKKVTVLFSDFQGFTKTCENM